MAVDLASFPTTAGDQAAAAAVQEAAAAGIQSMEHLIRLLSTTQQNPNLNCSEVADFTVSKFKRVISLLNRTGHARFRRGPSSSSSSSSPVSGSPNPVLNSLDPVPKSSPVDFFKPSFAKSADSKAPAESSTTSSFVSSITGDGSVSNGKMGLSLFPVGATATAAVSSGKPPLAAKRKCPDGLQVGCKMNSKECHCSSSKKRKSGVKKSVRVPARSSKIADIPSDEYSWRKYGQKPIKGSPYPRGYYRCSTVKGCPARKKVERVRDDPTMLLVTYDGDHRHPHATVTDASVAFDSQRR